VAAYYLVIDEAPAEAVDALALPGSLGEIDEKAGLRRTTDGQTRTWPTRSPTPTSAVWRPPGSPNSSKAL
jgi:hypothetical protein